jgi:LysM repeat protein
VVTQPVVPWGTYVVVYSDTLWDIGQRHGVTTDALAAANPQITDAALIHIGDEITIPPTDWTAPVQPLANGTVVDSDLDGVGDLVVDSTVEVGFNHGYWPGELRGVYEFDLRGVPRDRQVSSARVMIPVNGGSGDETDPHFTLFAGAGNGQLDESDFIGGTLVRTVDAYEIGPSIYLDLTDTFDRLHADGADFVTLVFRPNPLASATRGTIGLADSVDARYGFQEAQLTLKTAQVRWVPTDPRPHLIVQNVRVPSTTYCSLVAADITNYGDATEPSGWSITFEVPSLGISESFMGQWALAPSQRLTFDHNPQIKRRGTYEALVSVDDTAGATAVGHGTFSIPCGTHR